MSGATLISHGCRLNIAESEKIAAMRRRYSRFRTAHDYKPWKYYKGRDRWTPLPREFARRG